MSTAISYVVAGLLLALQLSAGGRLALGIDQLLRRAPFWGRLAITFVTLVLLGLAAEIGNWSDRIPDQTGRFVLTATLALLGVHLLTFSLRRVTGESAQRSLAFDLWLANLDEHWRERLLNRIIDQFSPVAVPIPNEIACTVRILKLDAPVFRYELEHELKFKRATDRAQRIKVSCIPVTTGTDYKVLLSNEDKKRSDILELVVNPVCTLPKGANLEEFVKGISAQMKPSVRWRATGGNKHEITIGQRDHVAVSYKKEESFLFDSWQGSIPQGASSVTVLIGGLSHPLTDLQLSFSPPLITERFTARISTTTEPGKEGIRLRGVFATVSSRMVEDEVMVDGSLVLTARDEYVLSRYDFVHFALEVMPG